MIQSKELTLKSIINSSEGIHLTSYLENRGNMVHFKKQISESIDLAMEQLSAIMSEEDLKRFIAPLVHLCADSKILKRFNSNIGIFRTKNSIRILNIPIDISDLCVIATSFHVKPLLRWIQNDKEFLLLGLEKDAITLYAGTLSSIRHIVTIDIPGASSQNLVVRDLNDARVKRLKFASYEDAIDWVDQWLIEAKNTISAPLFIAGETNLSQKLLKQLRYPYTRKKPIVNNFDRNRSLIPLSKARTLLEEETKLLLKKSMIEFYWAEDMNLGKKNVFTIAKAAVQGKIRKLLVADGIQIFGKMDKITGGLSINPFDLDHEDDDLLDDLAQTVLARGGEVVVVPRNQIPKGRPVFAILREDSHKITQASRPEVFSEQRLYG